MPEERVVERITTLEEKHAHQERIIADLNEVILDQQKRLMRLESLLKRADERIEQLHAAMDQPRSADDERPPHY
ncbi:SlyX family protein [Bremerella sp. T1]|uniref:SlyX family protein n=1 Tax=Bremerella sp. TYQ1 TaxID=3119568 RepID=UPI001CCE6EF2|nr:SlyX family protein [Bremerella volcania]UBM35490.1 SlyX family protein [Bremerella volcania]